MKKNIYIKNAVKEIDSPEFAHTKQILEVNEVEIKSLLIELRERYASISSGIDIIEVDINIQLTKKQRWLSKLYYIIFNIN